MRRSRSTFLALTGATLLTPGLAAAAPLTPALVFVDAAPLVKTIMLGLVACIGAAIVLAIRIKDGRSPFLASLRAGGPLAGFLGAAYGVLNMSLGLSNVPTTPPLKVLAPGFAEAVLTLGLGALTGLVAVIALWAVQVRRPQPVLGS